MSENTVQLTPQFSSSQSSVYSTPETESDLSTKTDKSFTSYLEECSKSFLGYEKQVIKKASDCLLSKDSFLHEKLKPEISHKRVANAHSKTLPFQPKYGFRGLQLFKTKKPHSSTDSVSSPVESEHITHTDGDTWKKSGWSVFHDLFDSAHSQSKKVMHSEPMANPSAEPKKDTKKFRSPFRRRSYTLDSSYKPPSLEEIGAKAPPSQCHASDEFATRRTVSLGTEVSSKSIPSISITDAVEHSISEDGFDNSSDSPDPYDYDDDLLDHDLSKRHLMTTRHVYGGGKTLEKSRSMEILRPISTETVSNRFKPTGFPGSLAPTKSGNVTDSDLKRAHSLGSTADKPLETRTLRKNSSSLDLAAIKDWDPMSRSDQGRPRLSGSKTFTASKLLASDVRPVFNEGRFYVADEILTTELNYLENLEIILNTFMIPIQKSSQTANPVISARDTKIIFEGIELLYTLSQEICQELREKVNHWSKETMVGDLFLKRQKDWEIYPRFVDNYSFAREAIRRAEATHSFNNFIKNVGKKDTKRQTLKELLIVPIQRVTRYTLLLKDLKKQTKPSHPDYPEVEKALESMTALAVKVNAVKQREEERTQLFTVFNAVRNCPPTMINANRRFTLETDVVETRTNRKMHLVLYSDFLMFTMPSRGRPLKPTEKWVFIRLIDLRHIIMFNVPDSKDGENMTIIFVSNPVAPPEKTRSDSIVRPTDKLTINTNVPPNAPSSPSAHSPSSPLARSPLLQHPPSGISEAAKKTTLTKKYAPETSNKYVLQHPDKKSKVDFLIALENELSGIKKAERASEMSGGTVTPPRTNFIHSFNPIHANTM
ncbi:hypothetical protein K493DRAFT_338402 [Basidiobolus meristosporus CBS 931.73]|uniref:DH domain-containing protein n=1 Tax=Basidiobolus meristosporus CBS 931.73 TaxID=1314790 RepID=A0A1Y1Y584_9FUNG|nr:hypothetical protein K493DRAFT_338402 [Basidiobolus meristosporus CBS 931.73]|eukprot:ORX93191.1 hypothetical protein K493DRAFT_338402 [Basidiobolus meristosporus CBS 931.73]